MSLFAFGQNMADRIFHLESELQNNPEVAAPEALGRSAQQSIAVPALAEIHQNWLNVVNINPKSLTTQTLGDLKAYFILNGAAVYLKDSHYAGINGNVSSDGWSIATPGLFNHSLFGGHSDGMLLSFYTWLRISQRMTAADARTTMSSFLGSAASRVSGGASTAMVDVTPIVFGSV